MTSETIDKTLTGIESLCELVLEKCYKARKELGLVEARTPRKGVNEKAIMQVIAKRNANIKKRKVS